VSTHRDSRTNVHRGLTQQGLAQEASTASAGPYGGLRMCSKRTLERLWRHPSRRGRGIGRGRPRTWGSTRSLPLIPTPLQHCKEAAVAPAIRRKVSRTARSQQGGTAVRFPPLKSSSRGNYSEVALDDVAPEGQSSKAKRKYPSWSSNERPMQGCQLFESFPQQEATKMDVPTRGG